MRELALHILDIAENSVAAQARRVEIGVEEDLHRDRLRIWVKDDGHGMDEEMVARVTDPFVTSRTTRKVGLGIPLLKAAAESCNGHLRISSAIGRGTCLEAEFQHSHIDRMPLGDLAGTLYALVVGWPDVRWTLRYRVNDATYEFDSGPIKQELGDVPLSEPAVLAFIRESLQQGIAECQQNGAEFYGIAQSA
ncbi:MAG: ATP-binding protein [Anaerolineae bacterium]|nr:ATP-binding protein [Thermoflexales bacterium]MDW8406467.1 ATP-binding protein [Anaerolineae bacterium]